jgi:hypothetical protein
MKRLVLAVAVLMLAALALVAFPPSPKVKEAALAPIALEAAPLATPQAHAAAPIASPPADATLAAGDASDSDCEAALKAMGVTFEVEAPVTGETGCGTERPLKVSSVGVELKPAITTRCPVAKALAAWTKDVVIPSAKLYMKDEPTALSTGDSYQCRTRRGDGETKISEHARANAVDITGVAFSGGRTLAISEQHGDDGARSFQAAIRGGACAYFPTVLGPGANAAHADHLHVDLIDRGNGYRICE